MRSLLGVVIVDIFERLFVEGDCNGSLANSQMTTKTPESLSPNGSGVVVIIIIIQDVL